MKLSVTGCKSYEMGIHKQADEPIKKNDMTIAYFNVLVCGLISHVLLFIQRYMYRALGGERSFLSFQAVSVSCVHPGATCFHQYRYGF